MKLDADIEWEDAMRRDNAYYAKLGAAAREAVGERPRMMIEGMTVDEISKKMILEPAEHDKETIYTRLARVAHRLANTPAPVVDPDALAKDVWRTWSTTIRKLQSPESCDTEVKFGTIPEAMKEACRAVAKMMEERK